MKIKTDLPAKMKSKLPLLDSYITFWTFQVNYFNGSKVPGNHYTNAISLMINTVLIPLLIPD